MPYEKISLRHIDHLRKRIQERVYTTLTPLKVEAWVTPEPVSFEDRKSGSHLSLSIGDGELYRIVHGFILKERFLTKQLVRRLYS
jgi:alpha-mannosidase